MQSSALDGSGDNIGGALFNTVNPALSVGMLDTIAPGARVPETVTYDATEAASTPPLGFMIVTHDNRSFNGLEAQLLALP